MKINLKNEDTLNITLPNGNKVEIESHNNISTIDIRNVGLTYDARIQTVSVDNYPCFNSVYTWFKGGLKKVSKNTTKRWVRIGKGITLFKN